MSNNNITVQVFEHDAAASSSTPDPQSKYHSFTLSQTLSILHELAETNYGSEHDDFIVATLRASLTEAFAEYKITAPVDKNRCEICSRSWQLEIQPLSNNHPLAPMKDCPNCALERGFQALGVDADKKGKGADRQGM